MRLRVLAGAALLVGAGCSSTGVVPMDKDTYMVSTKNVKVGFVSADEEKADVYRQANEFCGKQGKQVETVKIDMTPSGALRQASASLQFRCVTKAPG
jgi:hypothetical protein